MNKEQRLKEIDREIVKVGIIDAPGTILVGLGLYGKFAAPGEAFHPLLNDVSAVNLMLVVGGAIMIWGAYKVFSLSREKMRLNKAEGPRGIS